MSTHLVILEKRAHISRSLDGRKDSRRGREGRRSRWEEERASFHLPSMAVFFFKVRWPRRERSSESFPPHLVEALGWEERQEISVEGKEAKLTSSPLPSLFLSFRYLPGAVVRVAFRNFLTYDWAEFFPGPHLNMIIVSSGPLSRRSLELELTSRLFPFPPFPFPLVLFSLPFCSGTQRNRKVNHRLWNRHRSRLVSQGSRSSRSHCSLPQVRRDQRIHRDRAQEPSWSQRRGRKERCDQEGDSQGE